MYKSTITELVEIRSYNLLCLSSIFRFNILSAPQKLGEEICDDLQI